MLKYAYQNINEVVSYQVTFPWEQRFSCEQYTSGFTYIKALCICDFVHTAYMSVCVCVWVFMYEMANDKKAGNIEITDHVTYRTFTGEMM